MKIFKVIILEILILIFGISTDVRGESKDEIFNIEATFTTPSCKIIVPSTYHLGALTPGKVLQHSPLKLELSCSESVPLVTAIKGTVLAQQPVLFSVCSLPENNTALLKLIFSAYRHLLL